MVALHRLCVGDGVPDGGGEAALVVHVDVGQASRGHRDDVLFRDVVFEYPGTEGSAQATRVQNLAMSLHRKLQPQAPREARRELSWAAALHEMGMMVSHHDHHRHTAYLLAHVDAPGFSQNQLRRLGELGLGQRGGLRKMEASLRDEAFLWQLLALRLAVLIHHGRDTVSTRALQLTHAEHKVALRLPRAWMHENPRTLYLLREEVEAWARSGVLELSLT